MILLWAAALLFGLLLAALNAGGCYSKKKNKGGPGPTTKRREGADEGLPSKSPKVEFSIIGYKPQDQPATGPRPNNINKRPAGSIISVEPSALADERIASEEKTQPSRREDQPPSDKSRQKSQQQVQKPQEQQQQLKKRQEQQKQQSARGESKQQQSPAERKGSLQLPTTSMSTQSDYHPDMSEDDVATLTDEEESVGKKSVPGKSSVKVKEEGKPAAVPPAPASKLAVEQVDDGYWELSEVNEEELNKW